MPTTSNFGWTTPADTDLVKDGALAIRTLGNGIDTSMAQLKGGTTGQVLSKTSNTDMAFTWVTQDDANAIQNAIVDAKGDLITATANDTPARLAVGSNGDTLVADSAASTGLRWQGNYAAGKNKIINGDFRVNQRSFSSATDTIGYNFDRWRTENGTANLTVSAQTFTPGTAPVAGYEGINFVRMATTTANNANEYAILAQRIEDVRTFAGQTVTVSFWAKAGSGTPKVGIELTQEFGTGGSSRVTGTGQAVTLSTSWARYSVVVSLASISGKTIGTNSYVEVILWCTAGSNFNTRSGSVGPQSATLDFWGVQLEQGNVATAFQTATGTIQGEIALAQRYYFRSKSSSGNQTFGMGSAISTTAADINVKLPVTMRVVPTSMDYANLRLDDGVAGFTGGTYALSTTLSSEDVAKVQLTGSSGLTQYRPYFLSSTTSAGSSYIGFSAEL